MSVFKAYDIRGLAHSELDSDFAERLGKSLATHLNANTIAVARDIRESGPELHSAFLRGLNSSGVDVLDLGITTTGVLYRATVDLSVDAAVVITVTILLNIMDLRFVMAPYQWRDKIYRI